LSADTSTDVLLSRDRPDQVAAGEFLHHLLGMAFGCGRDRLERSPHLLNRATKLRERQRPPSPARSSKISFAREYSFLPRACHVRAAWEGGRIFDKRRIEIGTAITVAG
jgi:hypothetical protein